MTAALTLTDEEETNLYKARKLVNLGEDLALPADKNSATPIDREALAVFFQVIGELLPKR